MAETTGGVFINVDEATDLAEAMKTAATSYSDRDLLSIRYMKNMDKLFGFLRILFLSIVGALIGSLLALAYMDDGSTLLVIATSVIGSVFGSTIFELGIQNGVYQSILWLVLWIVFATTAGYIYPEDILLRKTKVRKLHRNYQGAGNMNNNMLEQNNVNIRV